MVPWKKVLVYLLTARLQLRGPQQQKACLAMPVLNPRKHRKATSVYCPQLGDLWQSDMWSQKINRGELKVM